MNTLILIVDRRSTWSPEAWATEHRGKSAVGNQIVIEQNMEWLSLVRDDRVLEDFDDEERSFLAKLVPEPATYLVEWKGSMLVESLLRAVPPTTRAAVDNDHGLLVPVHVIVDEPLGSWIRATNIS